MEQRPAAASARTRGLLAGVCLVSIIGGICATGKSRASVARLYVAIPVHDTDCHNFMASMFFRTFLKCTKLDRRKWSE